MNLRDILLFTGGVAVGAVAALLLAPTSGAELRAKIAKMLQEKGVTKDRLEDLVAKVSAKVKNISEPNELEIVVDEVLAEENK